MIRNGRGAMGELAPLDHSIFGIRLRELQTGRRRGGMVSKERFQMHSI
jgi:hypothetical protein